MARTDFDKTLESALIQTINNGKIKKAKFSMKKYQRFDVYIYDEAILNQIFDELNFKKAGNVFKYPKDLPQPERLDGYTSSINFDLFQRIAVSSKIKSCVMYSADYFSIQCMFLVSIKHLEKFLKVLGKCIREDGSVNIFRDVNFDCPDNSYIEIVRYTKDNTKEVEVLMKKLPNENLVFDKKSTLNHVMKNIKSFFTDDTKKMYDKLDLPYKRGIILYGDPGNGKSTTIRQIIRSVPNISKIIINPNVISITDVLNSLTKALDGRKAMIVIEDIDSVINDRNRSEFLNILDGVDIKSGLYFIGTTNYPERLDPAIMNRCGRFDRTYKIENPSEEMRRLFYKSRNLADLFSLYDFTKNKKGTEKDIIELLVRETDDFPMSTLKEIITSSAYLLASGEESTIKKAIIESVSTIKNSRATHAQSHNNFLNHKAMMQGNVNMPFMNSVATIMPSENIVNVKPNKTNIDKTAIDVDFEEVDSIKVVKVRRISK